MTTSTAPIRFCRTADGVQIAFASSGTGLPLIKTPNWLTHLELDPHSRVWGEWITQISRIFHLTRYDGRSCGLSDREVERVDMDTHRLDLDAVIDALGIRRFALLGMSQGGPIAIDYAARHPERVTHLILYGTYLRGALKRNSSRQAIEQARLMLRLVEVGWGQANSAFRQVFATQFIPDSTLEDLRAFDEMQKQTIAPEAVTRLLSSFYEMDVSEQASKVVCPTLVLHATEDARIPFEEGRQVAGAIRGAEFVSLPSRNHILLKHQPAWRQFFDEIAEFLRRHGGEAIEACPGLKELTDRERRVLDLVASGQSNREIAEALFISPKTVRNHINHIFSKLAVKDRAQAIIVAREAGMGIRKPLFPQRTPCP